MADQTIANDIFATIRSSLWPAVVLAIVLLTRRQLVRGLSVVFDRLTDRRQPVDFRLGPAQLLLDAAQASDDAVGSVEVDLQSLTARVETLEAPLALGPDDVRRQFEALVLQYDEIAVGVTYTELERMKELATRLGVLRSQLDARIDISQASPGALAGVVTDIHAHLTASAQVDTLLDVAARANAEHLRYLVLLSLSRAMRKGVVSVVHRGAIEVFVFEWAEVAVAQLLRRQCALTKGTLETYQVA